MLTLGAIQFTNILDFMIMMPLGPVLTAAFKIRDAQFALLVSSYSISAAVSGVVMANFVDRFDRKKFVLCLYTAFGLATLACALAPNFEAMLVARVLAGACGGLLSAAAQTIVGDLIPFERRGRAMAFLMGAFSVTVVAGVPLGLWLSNVFDWHAPFSLLAVACGLVALAAAFNMPPIRQHLLRNEGQRVSARAQMTEVLQDRNHQKALVFGFFLAAAGFTIIPFITIYSNANVGIPLTDIPLIYFVGGVATLAIAPFVGKIADSHGKVNVFRVLVLATTIPMFILSVLPQVPLWIYIVVTTAFFVLMSARMIPGMAIITSAANPANRGMYMSLSGAVQSIGMGVASLVTGAIVHRSAEGLLLNYWISALLGVAACVIAWWLAPRLKLA